MKLTESRVSFKVRKRQYGFKIIHDLPTAPGLSFEDAYTNWLARADDYTPESLCAYILGKYPDAIALTEKQYNDFITEP